MQFCTTCGRYLSDYDVICPECGTVIHPELIVAEPYRYRWPLFLFCLVASAIGAFIATFYLNAYFFFLFIPIVFFGWDRSRPLAYILMGISFGVGIGLVSAWIYSYSGLF